jgi:photosystem II stability/assembly factor-like uncharacterized protein
MSKKGMKHSRWLVAFCAAALLAPIPWQEASAGNRVDRLTKRPAMMSRKVTQSLLLDVAVNGKTVVAVGERGHVVVSRDNGNRWVQSQSPVTIMLTAVAAPTEDDFFVAGHEGLIMHTGDGGRNWTLLYGNPYEEPSDDSMEEPDQRAGQPILDLWFKDARTGFAVGAYGTLLHTEDGGNTWDDWSPRMPNEDQWHLNHIATKDGKLIYIAGEKGVLFRSDDGGESWVALTSPYDGSFFGALAGPGLDEAMVYGLQGNVYRTMDRGETWEQVAPVTDATMMAGTFLGGSNLVLVGNSGTILYSRDNGATFEKQVMGDRQSIVGIARNSEGKLIMVGQGGVRLASPALK